MSAEEIKGSEVERLFSSSEKRSWNEVREVLRLGLLWKEDIVIDDEDEDEEEGSLMASFDRERLEGGLRP